MNGGSSCSITKQLILIAFFAVVAAAASRSVVHLLELLYLVRVPAMVLLNLLEPVVVELDLLLKDIVLRLGNEKKITLQLLTDSSLTEKIIMLS